MKYNSHTIQFTHLTYTIQLFLVYSQSCVTIITITFRTFSSPPKEDPQPLVIPVRPSGPLSSLYARPGDH